MVKHPLLEVLPLARASLGQANRGRGHSSGLLNIEYELVGHSDHRVPMNRARAVRQPR
jgi:hypothetical protein